MKLELIYPHQFVWKALLMTLNELNPNFFGVSGTIEKYEIVGENQPLFRRAFVAKISELSASFMPIISILPYLLISKDGINDSDKLLVPNEVELTDIQEMVNRFKDVAGDIDGFLYDIQVETQNILLGALFDRTLEVRKSQDQRYLVLTSQNPGELEKVKEYVKETERVEI